MSEGGGASLSLSLSHTHTHTHTQTSQDLLSGQPMFGQQGAGKQPDNEYNNNNNNNNNSHNNNKKVITTCTASSYRINSQFFKRKYLLKMQMSIYIIQILFNFKISSVWYEKTQKEVWSTEKHASITLHRALPVFLSSIIEPNQSLVCFFSAWTKCFHEIKTALLYQTPTNK